MYEDVFKSFKVEFFRLHMFNLKRFAANLYLQAMRKVH